MREIRHADADSGCPVRRSEGVLLTSYLQFLLLGLGPGAVYAALGIGLALTFRSSGVINFAYGAIAMFATYAFLALRVYGDLLLPLPGSPGRIHVGVMATGVAATVAIAETVATALALHWLVFRPLRKAPPVAGVVASVGLMVAFQALISLQFGSNSIAVPRVLPGGSLSVFGTSIPQDRVYLTAIVVVVAAGLWLVQRFTRFGLASRAIAENEESLNFLGWSTDAVAAANWALAGVLAAGAGVLVGPITAADPLTFSLLVVPALAAALVGRLESFGITVAAALALGAVQSELLRLQVRFDWLPAAGIGEALPLLVIVAVAVARGSLLPSRPLVSERRAAVVGKPSHPVAGIASLFVMGVIGLAATHGEIRLALTTSLIGAVICLSIVVATGFLGQLSLAQMALAGVAGFTLSRLQSGGVPFPLDAIVAAFAATLAGLVISVPALRVRGPALAVATLAGGIAVEALIFEEPRLTGGLAGTAVRPPHVGGLSLGPGSGGDYPRLAFGLVALVLLCVAVACVARLRSANLGRRMLAVRSNERAAEASGVDVTATKLVGFAVSALLAGAGGVLIGWQQGQLSFGSFEVFASLAYVAVTYVGGVGRISGGLLGGALVANGIVFTALDKTAGLGRYQLFASGVTVVVTTVLLPDGLAAAVLSRVSTRPASRP